MEQNYNVITNLFIGITYLFSIILIIDELYNIGFFTFNYTYQFNYGSFTSKFNNIQTIECETSRFNVYNNIKFLYKDIFNKSYFNYLLLIVSTLITILCSVAYAVYFYFKFIIEQPGECSFTEESDLSLPKQLLKCLCDECHKLLPNCTSNYFVVFVLLIIIPLSYIFKTLFNINFTPNSNSALFGFIYICIFILLIFYYSFNLFNRKTENKYKDLIVHSLFTIIFISSGYIYKYIYSKYNNINLNTSNDNATIYDIYKQSPPIKPNPIQKPLYKGNDLLSKFKYNENDKDPEYKIKKTIVDDYHKSIKNYDTDMKNYNIRFNAYNNSLTSTKLGDKTNYFDITIKILGLNNYMHIYLIILIIISLIIYYIYNDDISYVCFIYALTLLIALTIMNSILYYNTYINKYVIYEPMAHYKNDITNANTALNLELNPSSGLLFYNKLINNDKSLMIETNSDIKDAKEILEDIKKLKDIKYYTSETTSKINNDITTYNSTIKLLDNIDKYIDDAIFVFNTTETKSKSKSLCINAPAGGGAEDPCYTIYKNPVIYLFNNLGFIKSAFTNDIKIEKIKKLTFKYSTKDIILNIPMTGYYKYCYYMLYQYHYLLDKCIEAAANNNNMIEITKRKDKLSNILFKLNSYKESIVINHEKIIANIKTKLNSYSKITVLEDKINKNFLFDEIDKFIKNHIKNINITILYNARVDIKTTGDFANSYIFYLNVVENGITISTIHIAHNENLISVATLITLNNSNYNNYLMYNDINYAYNTTNFVKGDFYIEQNYFELPSKISDNNDEYILTFKTSSPLITHENIYLYYDLKDNKYENYSYNSKYNINTPSNKITIIQDKTKEYTLGIGDLANYTIPFVLIKNNISKIDLFKKIILAVLFNGICNIQSKFESKKLFDSIKRYKSATAIEFQSNKIYIMRYDNLFTSAFISTTTKTAETLINNSSDYISFYILLFNAYNSQFIDIKKTITTNINYLINNSNKLTDNTSISTILTTIIDSKLLLDENINSDNSDFNKDDEILKLYNNNKPLIYLIIALFENLLITIKTTINKSSSYKNLCYPPSTSRLIIQDAMNSKFGAITLGSPNAGDYNSITKTGFSGDSTTVTLINDLNIIIRNYFNIVIFLLDNLKLNTNTAEIDAIMTNFNFYNRDDNVKSTIQKRLTISCDYYSKYNNMDSKQLSYFKINSDNVNYNFPILMIIFLIILGEPIFIKS